MARNCWAFPTLMSSCPQHMTPYVIFRIKFLERWQYVGLGCIFQIWGLYLQWRPCTLSMLPLSDNVGCRISSADCNNVFLFYSSCVPFWTISWNKLHSHNVWILALALTSAVLNDLEFWYPRLLIKPLEIARGPGKWQAILDGSVKRLSLYYPGHPRNQKCHKSVPSGIVWNTLL